MTDTDTARVSTKLDINDPIGRHIYFVGNDFIKKGYGTIVGYEGPDSNDPRFKIRMDDGSLVYPSVGRFVFTRYRVWFTAAERVEHLKRGLAQAEAEARADASGRGERPSGVEQKS